MLKKIIGIFVFFLVIFSGVEKSFATGTGFTSTGFMIKTSDFTISTVGNAATTSSELINLTLGTIIQKLMIGLGIVSFIVLVIGAAFMILAGGEDEYNNRGKSIFTAGILSLIVAMSSYYLVALVRFLVY